MRPILAALIAAAVSVSVAVASEPSSGTVSAASPTVSWTGTVASAGVTQNAWAQDEEAPCQAPACDRFTLEVADSGNLVVALSGFAPNTLGGDPGCAIRIVKPDGSIVLTDGTCGPKTTMRATIKGAAKGTYQIDVANSHVVNTSGPEDYMASATLQVAPAPVPPPPPAPTTPPQAAPPTMTAKVRPLSASKLKKARRFTATLSTTAPLTDVRALLVDRRRQVGSGRLARLESTGKLTVKLKKALKKGTYQLSVGGKDAQGRSVVATAKVRVRR